MSVVAPSFSVITGKLRCSSSDSSYKKDPFGRLDES